MMREVVFAIMAIIILGYLLYFITPMMTTLKDSGMQSVNMTNPVIANYFDMGDGLYVILGLVGFGVIGFLLFAYATRNELSP
jgi:type II secretory pathway component PulF